MAIHSLTIDRFSAPYLQIDDPQRLTSHRSDALRLCIVNRSKED